MKPKNFPGNKNRRRIDAEKRTGIDNKKIVDQSIAENTRTKKNK
jgi:hypothetical protein